MKVGRRQILLCDCQGTMPLDKSGLAKALGAAEEDRVFHELCRGEIDGLRATAAEGDLGEGDLVIACTQERQTFIERLAADGSETGGADLEPHCVNIRERAGWSDEAAAATPKIAALLAEATVDLPDVQTVGLTSSGVCLVYGSGATALEAARRLEGRLSVSLLLTDPGELTPMDAAGLMTARGRIAAAAGRLGGFEVSVMGYAALAPWSRGILTFETPRDGAAARCDIILDLSGEAALFAHPERQEGYLKANPGDPVAVERAIFDAADLLGEFEKPRYVTFREALCAHSRNRITGCTRCLDVCPVSAIKPAGDAVEIDPFICGGCGSCHSVCPTGAVSYAVPPTEALMTRLDALLSSYLSAGGERPLLLIHDGDHGAPLIEALARFGPGLPARALPFEVNEVTQVSLDLLLSALAWGAERLIILAAPEKQTVMDGLAQQMGLAEAIMTGLGYESGLVELLFENDPEGLARALASTREIAVRAPKPFTPQAEKRANLKLAAAALHARAPTPQEIVGLPPGAPYGAVEVRSDGCTLCLACVSACPTGALGDNPEMPQLSFEEEACVQCGLCRTTCPENVISLQPRLAFSSEARARRVLHEEEPFLCVSCGKPFAAKGTIEKMLEALAGKHSMFQGAAARQLEMCEDCRVIAQFSEEAPVMAGGARPPVRRTEDYLAERDQKARDEEKGD